MRLAALEMIRTLTNTVTIEDAAVAHIVQAARKSEQVGDHEHAKFYWALTRQRRVHLIELQARLAALRTHYTDIYHGDL